MNAALTQIVNVLPIFPAVLGAVISLVVAGGILYRRTVLIKSGRNGATLLSINRALRAEVLLVIVQTLLAVAAIIGLFRNIRLESIWVVFYYSIRCGASLLLTINSLLDIRYRRLLDLEFQRDTK